MSFILIDWQILWKDCSVLFTNNTILKTLISLRSDFFVHLVLGEPKKSEPTKYSLFKMVTLVNKTVIIFHFLCHSSSHYVIKSSTENDPNLPKRLEVFTSLFVLTFDVWKFLGFEEKTSNWVTDKLNCNVQSCFETFVDKYLKYRELKHFHAFRFLWFT